MRASIRIVVLTGVVLTVGDTLRIPTRASAQTPAPRTTHEQVDRWMTEL